MVTTLAEDRGQGMHTSESGSGAKTYHWLGGRALQFWGSIRIEAVGDSKFVIFCSEIHVNRESRVSFSYANTFSDWEILRDRTLVTWVINRYGADAFV
jgi:hypothetical protein